MMWIVLLVCIIVICVLYGRGILGILYWRHQPEEFVLADCLVAGLTVVTGLAEAAHLCAVFMKMPFSRCGILFGGMCILLGCLSLLVCGLGKSRSAGQAVREVESGYTHKMGPRFHKNGYNWGKAEKVLAGLLGGLVIFQVIFLLAGWGRYLQGDMTVETVGSFLYTDAVYEVNPLTGDVYQGGMPARLKILCLPSLYGMLCRIFALDPRTVVWTVFPLVTLVCSYGAFSCVGRCLFPGDRKKVLCFLAVIALLLWAEAYWFGMDGFGLLYSGWRGAVIRNLVLLPWLVSLCLRRKWRAVLLCVAAESCMVWTLYGLGVCAFVAVGLVACTWLSGRKQYVTHSADRRKGQ